MIERIVKSPVENQGVSRYYLRNKSGNFNGHIIDPGDMTVLSDSVLHMARAIIADTISLRDRKVKIDDGAKVDVPKVSLSKKKENKLSLESLKENFKEKSFEEKASFAELLSGEVKDEYEKIKSCKNVRDCVSNIKTALKDYKGSNTKENAKKVADAQLALIDVLSKKQCPKYVQETLGKIFAREAVEGFQKEFGDLKDSKTLHEMKWFLNKLYEDIKLHPDIKKYSDECESSLIYGFGHYPSSVRVDLKKFGKDPAKASNAVWAFVSMSLRYPIFSKNGKSFEIFDTGSQNDENCAFRAIAVGAGLGPNGYNEIQKKVIDGARELIKRCKGKSKVNISQILENIEGIEPWNKIKNKKGLIKFLEKYIQYRKDGFVGGMDSFDCQLAAIGLNCPICVIDVENGKEYTYLPDGKKTNRIRDDAQSKPIYIGNINRHSIALLPLDSKHKMPDDSILESEVKNAIKNSMISVMMKEIKENKRKKNNKLLGLMSEHADFYTRYVNENEKKANKDLFIVMDMMKEIAKNMLSNGCKNFKKIGKELKQVSKSLSNGITKNGKDIKDEDIEKIGSKLEEYIEIMLQEAMDICKDKPLFWYNYAQLLSKKR